MNSSTFRYLGGVDVLPTTSRQVGELGVHFELVEM